MQRPDRILFIGDSVVDRYSWDGQVHLRAGCVANLLRAATFEGNSIDLISTFPDADLLGRLLPSGRADLRVTLFPSRGPLNVVDYTVVDGRVVQLDDHPRPCPHDFDEEMASLLQAGGHEVIAVADYGLGTLGPRTKAAIRTLGASDRAQVLVDARHANFDDYRGASWFLPTLDEFHRYRVPGTIDARSPTWFVKVSWSNESGHRDRRNNPDGKNDERTCALRREFQAASGSDDQGSRLADQ